MEIDVEEVLTMISKIEQIHDKSVLLWGVVGDGEHGNFTHKTV